jgi:hypothetical protein
MPRLANMTEKLVARLELDATRAAMKVRRRREDA